MSQKHASETNSIKLEENISNKITGNNQNKYLKLVTRGTSPTQPSSLSCVRSRRLDAFEVLGKDVPLFRKTIKTKDEDVQVDRNEDSRFSELSGSTKISGAPWASYLDKFNSSRSSTGISYSSRIYTLSGISTASRLDKYGLYRSNETPSCSRSDAVVKMTSGSSCDTEISRGSNHNYVKPKLQNANETPKFSNGPIEKNTEAEEEVNVEEERKKYILTSEEPCQRALYIPSVSNEEMRSARQTSSLDARRRTPTPINEEGMKNKTAGMSYINEDFRKPMLNMQNCNPTHSQMERTCQKKKQKSMSASPQGSQSETNSKNFQQANYFNSSTLLKLNRSNLKVNALSNAWRTESKEHSSKALFAPVDSQYVEETPALKIFLNTEESCKSSSSYSFSSEKGCHIYPQGSSSGTSVLGSSADELCLEMEQSLILPSGSRSKQDRSGNTEEAKLFAVKTLVPATTIFITKQRKLGKIRSDFQINFQDEYSDSTKKPSENVLPKTMPQSLSKSSSFGKFEYNVEMRNSKSRIKHYSSSEKPWWMDPNSDNVPEGVERNSSGNDDISQETTVSTMLPDDGMVNFFLIITVN